MKDFRESVYRTSNFKRFFLMATLPEIGKTPTFNIPIVDLSAFLQGKVESEAVQDLVKQIRLACSTSGFFQIVGHGVSLAMQDSALRASKALFSLPEEEKLKLKERPGIGYETFGAQILEAGRKPDLKEVSSFHCLHHDVLR